ncbi:tRNA (adenosine(37)-N6)-dimethylallyltransferase MiaA [Saxibacter everestensis]|uniref:tRNA dimethylallyltransferase n=1 Tax=Saxibacter everestensis TaxID=2909229 RepID=A0ABY8QVX8_9MICO|nr:tRNA (adenosine(37)-N6)-dimethylallyltransferase MiaA [Brevibacteriaceae bacterium ZFBP1038]
MHTTTPPLAIAVIGATATGKSDLALDLAEELGAEIVNADAMQFYRGMDIGTAKLPVSHRRGIAHHLLDILDVTEDASVARYQQDARAVVRTLRDQSSPAILVGGSGLYVRAVVDDLEFPGHDPQIRAALERRAETEGPGVLYQELLTRDPAAAEKIAPANVRRVVRALEVIELTGQPFSATLPEYRYVMPTVQLGLRLDRGILDDRIARRVVTMWDQGLVDEVRTLEERGLRSGTTARRALGYAQILDYFDGRCSQDEAIEATIVQTRQFARRQETWFRRDKRVDWLDASSSPATLLREARGVVEAWKQ